VIKKFNEHNGNSPLKKVWYIQLYDLRKFANDDVERLIDSNNYNNGHAINWYVNDPKDAQQTWVKYVINNDNAQPVSSSESTIAGTEDYFYNRWSFWG
jgi:hypothetical protein